MEPSEIYTSKIINDYNTNVLTPLGKELWDRAEQKELTLNLNIKEIDFKGHRITMQRISRALYGNTSAPETYEVKIEPIPESVPEKKPQSWWSRFWTFMASGG